MTNSLPQRASALKSEARRALLANRDQIGIAELMPRARPVSYYINQRADLIREASAVLSTTEISDLTGLTRQRIHQILNPSGDALKERGAPREAQQAEHELTEAVTQQTADPSQENAQNVYTVASNILAAGALTQQEVLTITGWTKADLHRLAYGGPAHLRIPEADV